VLIDRALRDEGTSYHYLPPATFAWAPDTMLFAGVEEALTALPEHYGLSGCDLDDGCALSRNGRRNSISA
jgi:hypothetical protein